MAQRNCDLPIKNWWWSICNKLPKGKLSKNWYIPAHIAQKSLCRTHNQWVKKTCQTPLYQTFFRVISSPQPQEITLFGGPQNERISKKKGLQLSNNLLVCDIAKIAT